MDELNTLLVEMQKKQWMKNTAGRATKIINDFITESRGETLKTLHELTQNKIDSSLTPREEKVLLEEVIQQIKRELKL